MHQSVAERGWRVTGGGFRITLSQFSATSPSKTRRSRRRPARDRRACWSQFVKITCSISAAFAVTARDTSSGASAAQKTAASDVFAAARALRLDDLADPALVAVLPGDACASPGTCHRKFSDPVAQKRGGKTVSDKIGTAFVSASSLLWPSAQSAPAAIRDVENPCGQER